MRFTIGNPGSGTQASMLELLGAMGWKTQDFSLASELKADEHGPALCDGKIDGFFYAVGHPSANIQDPTTTCGAKLVPLTGPAVDRLVKEKSYYAKATIPAGLYRTIRRLPRLTGYWRRWSPVESRRTRCMRRSRRCSTILTNSRNCAALAILNPQSMIKDGLSAPLHDGAAKYYREKGWLK
jgi:TRAP-type uncharacterized transport system substrate-binding protein